ncbi:MAG: bifunctional glutamate N-acetyltransferase/amino-acid acetyltransferase ArgJ [Spirochaetales bacterium]|jgi:glutamate N-acetyltransferase/amino-acid N-acetyltransferase|nr:bifunctional glutamate N-acetyltransferase/amino-acid acetyltransferase ArgJ [Spirochaetales bacterium]
MVFTNEKDYLGYLESLAGLPEGFRAAAAETSFFPKERPVEKPLPLRLALVLLDKPSAAFGALFTRNRFPGAPVLIGRERLKEGAVRGVLINNKISNVCAPRGVEDAEEVLGALAEPLGLRANAFFPASTGIIGWSLPVKEMKGALPGLCAGLHRGSCLDAARAIMTTDAYPKVHSVPVGEGRILGFAKGAGMIEPNLATMLVFLLTDIDIGQEALRQSLSRAAERTFNCMSVDSDQSTSDTVIALSSGTKPSVAPEVFEAALEEVCAKLAHSIVRNGEGVSHVMRLSVSGAKSFAEARDLAKAVVNSPLVKTAVYGNDPNVGRIVSAIGDWAGNSGIEMNGKNLLVRLGEETIFENGAFALEAAKEKLLSAYLQDAAMDPQNKKFPPHEKCVDIFVQMKDGDASAVVYGADLSREYVTENADYRS